MVRRKRTRRKKKLSPGFIWTLVILLAISYIVFYTIQTQRVLELDKRNHEKKNQIQTLSEQIAGTQEKKDQLTFDEVKQKAINTLGMKMPDSYNALPHPKYWPNER